MEENKEQELEKQEIDNKQEDEITKVKQELEDTTDRYKRIMAEFDNFKKRSLKEREGMYNSLIAQIVTSILPILDNLEKAVSVETQDNNYKQGVEMVLKQFTETLLNLGVEQIKTIGETFNPEYHEAVSSVQDDTLGEKQIKEEFRKGYKIGDKVIRHSMVVVAN
ncbi:MAG: nucleotide exchange factor GrpE [Clostridia bacterium]|jgi:molecular chaperone GrpE|nr:nucleotide exchange factor GrpE [Clostridia bacterium]